MSVAEPLWLFAAAPWLLLCLALWRRQESALAWLRQHTASRGFEALTRYARRGPLPHMALLGLLGILLAVAAAGPRREVRGTEAIAVRDVVLLVDASFSMGAEDARRGDSEAEPVARMELARTFARELVRALPDSRIGLVTYSGVAVVHAPPTVDHRALDGLVAGLGVHVDLPRSGTRPSTALSAVVHLLGEERRGLQVVLLSDGELPQADDDEVALELLRQRGVPVHTVAFGTQTGQARVIYDFDDVRSGAEEKRVVRRFTTRTDAARLAALAESTGGRAVVVEEGGWVAEIAAAVAQAPPQRVPMEHKQQVDLSALVLLLFALLLAFERSAA